MKKTFTLILGCIGIITCYSQNPAWEFTKALRDGDTVRQKEILALWESAQEKSADYYIASFNYNLAKCMDGDMRHLDVNTLGLALDVIEKGIKEYPSRLDMRCGEISALYRFGLWNDFADRIIRSIDYAYVIDNKWIYPDQNADKDFFLNIVQQYQADLFNEIDEEIFAMEDSLNVIRIRKISETVLKYYPDNIEAMNNMAATYFMVNEYDKALEIFLQAEKLSPKDAVILLNIANIYTKQGNKEKSKLYYENIIKNCGKDAAAQANILLKEL